MKKAFFVPYSHMNEYVEINKRALIDAGFEPIELNVKSALHSVFSRTPIVINWLEDRPYGSNFSARVSFTTTIKCFLILIFSLFFCSKKVWVKHNFKPHNKRGSLVYFRFLKMAIVCCGFKKLTLEEYAGGGLLHPLYLSDEKLEKQTFSKLHGQFTFLFFGAVKRYKGLHKILEMWPPSTPLQIIGKCSDTRYKKELLKIIDRQGLSTSWVDEYVSDEVLNRAISSASFVVMSHLDNTMISSGSFYHAISYGCNILATKSEFALHKQKQHEFVHVVQSNHIDIKTIEQRFVSKEKVQELALESYSRAKLSSVWSTILS